jgi:hypothetical protein
MSAAQRAFRSACALRYMPVHNTGLFVFRALLFNASMVSGPRQPTVLAGNTPPLLC